ncbi:aspartate/glutamate racemase family protein [Mycolicibacterium septicum]|uniref:glutamate racemase n=1 Tax=Mycolicibacterium septicum TaxID=98668 RepID=UPI0023E2BC0F|nr:aspartate/glutamate racemase family protein [Mycolicibacterium septicum]MDF3341732.1 aspartate/glutamate racemase family protein [Mycolicibacterium septicum]
MTPEACLGIVDWGIGGIGLVRELDRVAPGLPVLYWSDAGALPYGRMRTADLTARLTVVIAELAERGATEVVLACNAASTVAPSLSQAPLPVEGIIGHGLASVPDHLRGPVGIVGGRRTIASGCYRRGLARPGREVLSRVAQPLSAHIEAGSVGSPGFVADLRRIVAPLQRAQAVVLACTHYPAVSDWFADALPDAVLIDPVQRLAAAIAARHPAAQARALAQRTYLTSGDAEAMRRGAEFAWGVELTATTCPLPARIH